MRNYYKFFLFLAWSVIALTALGCTKEEEKKPEPVDPVEPTLTIEESVISVPVEGGSYSINYELKNPVEGGVLTVVPESDEEWVSDFTIDESASAIGFDVYANESVDMRSLSVSVSYTGLESDITFTIEQAGLTETPVPFVITPKNIESSYFTVDVTPYDKEMSYILFAKTKQSIEEAGLATDDALYEEDMKYIESSGQSVEDFCISGDLVDKEFSAEPSTEYVVYAYGVDPGTRDRLTDIVRADVTTLEAEKEVVILNISADVKGVMANVTVAPQAYEGYYYCECYETASIDTDRPLMDICSESFYNNVSETYLVYGYTNEQILERACSKGEDTYRFELKEETAYTIVAYAVNGELEVYSDPSTKEIVSGTIASDNIITINVSDIEQRSANVTVTTTNDDPYIYIVLDPDDLAEAGQTDEDILEYIQTNYYLGYTYNGNQTFSLDELSPASTYSICAFGYFNGTVTTDLVKKDFMTEESVSSEVSIVLTCDKYYDISEIYEIDPSAVSGWDRFYDIYLPVIPVVQNTDEDVDIYYTVYEYDSSFDTATEQELQERIYYNACLGKPRDPEGQLFTLYYEEEVIAVGFAIDAEGNWGPIYKSEPFTVTADGASDAQEFIDLYASDPESASMKVSVPSRL